MGFHTLPSACWSLLSYWLALAYWHHMPAPTEIWFLLLGLILNILPWSLPWSPAVRTLHSLPCFLKPHSPFCLPDQSSDFCNPLIAEASGTFQVLCHNTHILYVLYVIHWRRKIQRCLQTTLPGTFLRHYLRCSILRHLDALSCLVGRILFPLHGKTSILSSYILAYL